MTPEEMREEMGAAHPGWKFYWQFELEDLFYHLAAVCQKCIDWYVDLWWDGEMKPEWWTSLYRPHMEERLGEHVCD